MSVRLPETDTNLPSAKSTPKNYMLLYAGKPTYGGWVSFTAHLSHQLSHLQSHSQSSPTQNIYKIGKRSESRWRTFGYNCSYQNNTLLDIAKKLSSQLPQLPQLPQSHLIVTAVDHNYYSSIDGLFQLLVDRNINVTVSVVVHDPTEVAGKKAIPFLQLLQTYSTPLPSGFKIDIITIRPRVKEHLETKYNLSSECRYHPFYPFKKISQPSPTSSISTPIAVSISRIDHDKHTNIIVEANNVLSPERKITIYGAMNGFYAYKKLHNYDSMKRDDPKSMYRGTYPKDWDCLASLLQSYQYVVDLSIIKGDGGHTQYTFLESVYLSRVLILHRKWISGNDSIWVEGVNCLAIESSDELVELLNNPLDSVSYQKILDNSKKILDPSFQIWK